MSVLEEILRAKRDEVTRLHRPAMRAAMIEAALAAPVPRDFGAAIRRADGRLAVIAEIKRRSPSKGEIAPGLDPAITAKAYEAGGASALSVLTDPEFFGGSLDDLRTAREATRVPVLRKDFIIDEVQVYEARAAGADAVLLIVAAVPDDALLADLHALAAELGLAALVEVHDAVELDRALGIGAVVVGVNCRDLATFAEDLGTAEELADRIPTDVIAVAESGIRNTDDAARMARSGFDATLVGEMLVRLGDPAAALRGLAELERRPRGGAR
jgi:indole-3-glycerol phosphate synthase